jgi:hypothetical protein
MDAVRRECGQLLLHLWPAWSRLFAGSDYRQRFVTKASRAAHLGHDLGGGTEFFGGGSHWSRRGVEGLELLSLLWWQRLIQTSGPLLRFGALLFMVFPFFVTIIQASFVYLHLLVF